MAAAVVGLDFVILALIYGYCLAAQPAYATPGAKRVAAWTFRQPFFVRCAIAFTAWLTFMTGLYLFVHRGG